LYYILQKSNNEESPISLVTKYGLFLYKPPIVLTNLLIYARHDAVQTVYKPLINARIFRPVRFEQSAKWSHAALAMVYWAAPNITKVMKAVKQQVLIPNPDNTHPMVKSFGRRNRRGIRSGTGLWRGSGGRWGGELSACGSMNSKALKKSWQNWLARVSLHAIHTKSARFDVK
jgi:hypothetical protein